MRAQRAFKVWCEWGFDQHGIIELFDVGGNAEDRHGFKPAKGVATFEELPGVPFVECASDEEGNVIDHVAVS